MPMYRQQNTIIMIAQDTGQQTHQQRQISTVEWLKLHLTANFHIFLRWLLLNTLLQFSYQLNLLTTSKFIYNFTKR